MKERKKRSIKSMLIHLSVIPAVAIGVILIVISVEAMFKGMTNEISNSLSVAAHSVYNTYSVIAPGDFTMVDGVLKKGDQVIGNDYTIVDALKESYDMEISLFYGDERALTTIKNEEGVRVTGTKAQSQTAHWVLENGKEYFSQNVKIDGVDYFGYYIPIYNTDKTVVGMAFAGKKHSDVMNSLLSYILRAVGIAVLVIIVTLLCCIVASQHIITAFDSIMEYLGRLANGDFSMKMPTSVLKRQDEIGDMGHYAYMVGVSLKDVITTDPLTGLLNRRASKRYLEKWISSCNEQNEDMITVGIGDIDFFKKINDTYGHDGGDVVLREVSSIFQKHMEDEGIAARWGGEEFLLVFQCPLSEARQELQDILEEIRDFDFEYEGKHFNITLTFGLNGTIIGNDYDEIIKAADACLYKGKESGRNRIITTEGQVILPGQECREVPIAEQETETAKEGKARTAQSTAPALD